MLNRTVLAVLLAAPPAVQASQGRFLAIVWEAWGDTRLSFTTVYGSAAEAERAAENIGLCGYWRVDLMTAKESFVAPGAVREIHPIDPEEIPPPPIGARLVDQLGDPPPLPPLPDVARLVNCPAAGRSRWIRP
jgi:hypothetical protein